MDCNYLTWYGTASYFFLTYVHATPTYVEFSTEKGPWRLPKLNVELLHHSLLNRYVAR